MKEKKYTSVEEIEPNLIYNTQEYTRKYKVICSL